MVTPVVLETLLHCYYRSCELPPDTPAVNKALGALYDLGLIEEKEKRGKAYVTYTTTPKGKAHVKQLCSLPFPTQQTVWLDYKGEVL